VDDLTRKRLQHNEAVFRAINEELDEAGSGAARDFICECADALCTETVRLTHAEYRAVRSAPNRFVLVPGHEVPELEDVVRREGDHVVVEKR
jgi:hypothetical protein